MLNAHVVGGVIPRLDLAYQNLYIYLFLEFLVLPLM